MKKRMKKRISMMLAAAMLISSVQIPMYVQAEEQAVEEAVMKEYDIVPSPHSIAYEDVYTEYVEDIHVVSVDGALDDVTEDYIEEIFGAEHVTYSAEAAEGKTNLYLSRDNADDAVENWIRTTYAEEVDDAILAEDESHIIVADENGISILGNDDVGLFRGLTTIKYILSQIQEDERGYRNFVIKDYTDMAFRGLIEGYYGEPWPWADKADLLRVGSDFKMNKIVFAPKNDPYHYNQWADLYPNASEDAENNIQNVQIAAEMGRKYKVDFVWTAHCFINNANGITYKAGDENVAGSDINLLKAKFQQLYDVGVRSFGLLLDDIEFGPRTGANGLYNNDEPLDEAVLAETTAIINIMADWCAEKGDCDDLIFCPAGFVTSWMRDGFPQFFKQQYPYQEISYYDINFRDNVHIMTTGNGVFSDTDQSVADNFKKAGISAQTGYETGDERRSPLMWTNYPTVDANPELDLGPIEYFRTNLDPDDMVGLLSNPFQWAHINKAIIPMVTQYTWNLKDYDAEEVYAKSLNYLMGSEELGEAMVIFSNHNNKRGSEGEGSPELLRAISAFKTNYNEETANAVLVEVNKIVAACDMLLVEENHKDAGLYAQLLPYVKSLRDLAGSVQKFLHIFTPEIHPVQTCNEAKALYSSHTTYDIGTQGKKAVTGLRTLKPFAEWLNTNSSKLIAASNHDGFELEMLIVELENMDFTWHTQDSVDVLNAVLAEAKAVSNNLEATEEERAEALAKLEAAREALVFVLEGKGTEEAPYLIADEDDLIAMSTVINGSDSFADDHYKLTADIFMTKEFQPIGSTNYFSGVFDGDGHFITNLIISQGTETNVGLFAFVEGGTVKNVGIRRGSISGANKVGALVGRTMYATITNCYSKADVVAVANDCGGLVGMLNNSMMSNCFTWGTVKGGGESIGGLCGAVNRSIDLSTACTVRNCYTLAQVTGPKFTGNVIGYDESSAGEKYTITYDNLYYDSSLTPFGNNTSTETIGITAEQFKNGELLAMLNGNLAEGDATWIVGLSGYPEFVLEKAEEIDTAELDALIAEVEAMDLSSYSTASAAALNSALASAKALKNDPAAVQADVTNAIESIQNAINALVEAPYLEISTNMAQYDVYSIQNVVDGDLNSLFWKSGAQTPGDYILFTFGKKFDLSSVRFVSSPNSDMLEGGEVQVSVDGTNWTKVGTLTYQADQTVKFDTVNVKYVRIYVTKATNTWLKVCEVIFNEKILVDKTELESLVAEIEALDLSIYTEDTASLLNEALEQARNVLANDSATKENVETAISYLQMRKGNLVEKPKGPAIVTQPTDVCVVKGETAVVSVETIGENLTYTWYYKNPGNVKFYKSSNSYVSEEGTTYAIPMYAWRDGQQVYCVIKDEAGTVLQTNTVTVTMKKASIEILKQPAAVAVPNGEYATVTVEAEGEGLTYTWYYKNPGNVKFYKSGSQFVSEDGTSYSIQMNRWRDGQQVYCVITDAAGDSVTTNTVKLSMTE